MARKPAFKHRKTPSGWKVEIPERLSPTGVRQRAFSSTRDEAKDFATSLREKYEAHGEHAVVIKPSLAEEAVEAAALLEPFGISLLEAARAIVASKTADLQSSTMDAALTEFIATPFLPPSGPARRLVQGPSVRSKFLAAKFLAAHDGSGFAVEVGGHVTGASYRLFRDTTLPLGAGKVEVDSVLAGSGPLILTGDGIPDPLPKSEAFYQIEEQR